MAEWDIIPPPANVTVFHDHRPVLYGADGKAYVRQAGFVTGDKPMAQGSGVFPQLTKPGQKIGKKGSKRGG